jgi:hypothetical protein
MDSQQTSQLTTASNQLPQSWYFYFYFSPPTWSAGTRGDVTSMTT